MDIISFNEAATANGRIEKFIENPDSTSGVVTVPKVIASGETITIPAGRVAILPNVQIDGVLNIENDGEVFIPSGATFGGVVEKVTSTDNAIVRFDGVAGAVQNSNVIIDDNGNVLVTGGGGLGYGTGSGGTVTQLTSKGTAVTLNKPTGTITMNSTALIQNSKVSFLLYNSLIASTDNIILSVVSGSTVLSQYEARGRCSNSVAEIVVSHTYSSSLSEAIVLNFAIIKGATA